MEEGEIGAVKGLKGHAIQIWLFIKEYLWKLTPAFCMPTLLDGNGFHSYF